MKLKTWHLFLVIIILFGCSFYVVNLNFDKFYRLNGINNDNRVLIEKYLDETEQNYLIENQISIDLFIDYLKKDDFHLQNYQYYNSLENTDRYSNSDKIIEIGNNLNIRLTHLYRDNAYNYSQLLIESDLEMAFLNSENFNFDYFEYYKSMKPLYASSDYSFVGDTEMYVTKLNLLGITDSKNLQDSFYELTQSYTKNSLKNLLTTSLPEQTHIVMAPYKTDTIVDKTHYVGQYEPTGLILTQDIPRVRYAMYLQGEAYNALTHMYEAITQNFSDFLLLEAYQSAQTLPKGKVGYSESQLGLTIEVTQSKIKYADFKKTKLSQWLEEHAYEYGYILRYPNKKASITNHNYDPHVYRYVGVELAKVLHDSQMTLEEYQENKE